MVWANVRMKECPLQPPVDHGVGGNLPQAARRRLLQLLQFHEDPVVVGGHNDALKASEGGRGDCHGGLHLLQHLDGFITVGQDKVGKLAARLDPLKLQERKGGCEQEHVAF